MLDIEEKFQTGNYKNELLESIHSELQKLKDVLNSGLNPADYNKYSKYVLALESSLLILNQTRTPDSPTLN
ncbi:MAG: hypothetical protein V3V19_08265 [Cocleimonas sp.]